MNPTPQTPFAQSPGLPPPVPAETPQLPVELPRISELQANFHVHTEGVKAEAAARSQGYDPLAANVLLNAAAGGAMIGQMRLPPVTAGFVLMLEPINRACDKTIRLNSDYGNMMAMAYALHFPQQMWDLLAKQDGALLEETVWAFGSGISLPSLKQMAEFIFAEIARLKGDVEEAKK